MGLKESLEEDERQLAELEASEKKETVSIPLSSIPESSHMTPPQVAENPDGETQNPEKEQPKVEEERSDKEWAKIRFDERRAKRTAREEELAAQLASANAVIEEMKNPKNPAPKKDENWEGYVEHRQETTDQRLERLERENKEARERAAFAQQLQEAKEDFDNFELGYSREVPDYEKARTLVVNTIYTALRVTNPQASHKQILHALETQMLIRGQNAYNAGINPAHAIYEEAKALGYQKEQPEQKKQPSVKDLASNAKRSAGMVATGGSGNVEHTAASVLGMSNREAGKLSEEDWKRLANA